MSICRGKEMNCESKMSHPHLGAVLLLITTIFWGAGFVAQKLGAGHLGPNAIIVLRSIIAAVFLMLVQAVRRRRVFDLRTWKMGAICGISLFVPMFAQQKAFEFDISPGVCAFLTANYMLLVPVIGVFVRRKASKAEWFALFPALVGTYLICVTGEDSFKVGLGELWTLLCAFLFAVEILVVDRLAPDCDTITLSIAMFASCAVLGAPCLALPSEFPLLTAANLKAAIPAILFLGLGSSGIGYTLQNVAQGLHTPPALASIIMSLESVCGAVFGWLFFSDVMSTRCLIGCIMVFCAALGAELFHICTSKAE